MGHSPMLFLEPRSEEEREKGDQSYQPTYRGLLGTGCVHTRT